MLKVREIAKASGARITARGERGGGGFGGINEFSQVTHGSSSTSSGAVSILMKCARAILKHSCFYIFFQKKKTQE